MNAIYGVKKMGYVTPRRREMTDLLALPPTISHSRTMSVATETTAYRYLTHSVPRCGIVAGPLDIHAETRADADLMVLRVQERFYGGHAQQDNTTFEWTVHDSYGRLLCSATTTPEGTTYHHKRA